jgi:serine/threonine protein kinase
MTHPNDGVWQGQFLRMGGSCSSKLAAETDDWSHDINKKTPTSRLVNRQKFHFGSIIGEGGFAVIREVRHILDDKWFALKENNLMKVTNDDAKVILNELNCLVRLSLGGSHSCIVKLHLAFRDLRSTYMVLDLLTGGDLRIYLGNRELFNEHRAAFLIASVGSALNHMHTRKMIHRDLKPENILFDSHGIPYVTDFGLSYCLPPKSRFCVCEKVSGTSEYFAPEIFVPSTHYHGFESDFWSLGVILYEILFRKRPCDDPPKPLIRYSRDTYESAWARLMALRDRRDIHCQQADEVIIENKDQNFDDLVLPSSEMSDPDFDSMISLPCYPFSKYLSSGDVDKEGEENDLNEEDQDKYPLGTDLQIPIPPTLFSQEQTSPQCIDLLNALLDVRIHRRIGVDSRYALFMNHPWFHSQGIVIDDILTHTSPSPITPDLNLVADKICAKLMKTNFEDENQQVPSRNTPTALPLKDVDNMIGSFTYLSPEYSAVYPQPLKTPKLRFPISRALSLGSTKPTPTAIESKR